MRAFALGLVLLASAAAAQTPRLALRAAFVPAVDRGAVPDTAAMERAALADGSVVYLGETLQTLGAGSVTDAILSFDAFTDAPEISLTMTGEAARTFARITEARVGRAIAVVLDGRVLTAPTVNGVIPNGRVQITGQFTRSEAEAIAAAVREVTQVADAVVDLASPEAAALAIRRAATAGEWLTVARILHPTTLHVLRGTFDSSFVIAGDSVRASPTLPACPTTAPPPCATRSSASPPPPSSSTRASATAGSPTATSSAPRRRSPGTGAIRT